MHRKNAPIGVFDSGMGGLTVLKALQEALPHEEFIYIADSAHSPYGTKGAELVHQFSQNIANYFECHQVKAIVVACNTASAVLKQQPLQNIEAPVFEVITPTVKSVQGQHVGAIGTATTIGSGAYAKALQEAGKGLEWAKATPMLVPLVEEGLTTDPIADVLLKHYLADLPNTIDTLILGCTHYPMLKGNIQKLLPNVTLVDAADATAAAVKAFLVNTQMLTETTQGKATLFTTGDAKVFNQLQSLAGFTFGHAKKLDLISEAELSNEHDSNVAVIATA
tara:strand:- start:42 stop:878 length:837 start_codon:yes stop_codon:yes gene_type:complete